MSACRGILVAPIRLYQRAISPALAVALQVPPVVLRVRGAGRSPLRYAARSGPRRLAAAALQSLEPRRSRLRRGPDPLPHATERLADARHPQPADRCVPVDPGVLARPGRRLSWGWSIILLTFTVRIAILPLTFKGVKSMQRLQTLQPEIKEIQERYKDDRQRMNQEIMAFYQREKVNPLGSCLPLLLQIPFFISLFYLLRSDEFKADIAGNAAFGPIDNLAETVSFSDQPVLLVTLIVLYVGTQLAASDGHGVQRRPDAAPDHARAAVRLRDLHHQLRGRADRVLDHHERLDDRPAAAGQEALPEARARRPRPARRQPQPARGKPPAEAARRRPCRRESATARPRRRRRPTARQRRAGQGPAALAAQEEEALGRRR